MKFFKRIRTEIPTQPFLDEIASVDDAWSIATGGQTKIQVQREARAIPIRGLRKSKVPTHVSNSPHPTPRQRAAL